MRKLTSENMPYLRQNSLYRGRLTGLLSVAITLILFVFFASIRPHGQLENTPMNVDSKRDRLAYVSDAGQLMLYNPDDRTQKILLDKVRKFAIARDDRVAFTRLEENDSALYVFDPSTPTLAPINVSLNSAAHNDPISWSPDGRYLAFSSYQDERDQFLYVWDGETTINIMPTNGLAAANRFYIDWSSDGRLAFTVYHVWSDSDILDEIYLWDGSITSNLSQNPKGWDGDASWSKNGQLMFFSRLNDENSIYMWDGVSFKDSFPDRSTFIRVAPEWEPKHHRWTDDGLIAFTVYTKPYFLRAKAIVLWDMESKTVVKQFSVSSDNQFSRLEEGDQVILSSQLASGLPSVYLDVENTKGQILFSTHTGEYSWSPDGYLAYCKWGNEDRKWTLSLWSAEGAWDITEISYKPVQWQQGLDTFSCNNG
jgi:hypothetical protein